MADRRTSPSVIPGWLLVAWSGLAAAGCSSCFGGCDDSPPAERIRARIAEAVALAEQGDGAGLLEMTSGDFRVSPGGWDARRLRLRLGLALRRLGRGSIHYPRPTVELEPNGRRAETEFAFLTVRGEPRRNRGRQPADDWLAELASKAGLMRIHLWWRLEDDRWLVSQARLERFRGTGFRVLR
jgi:hypothetical protein